MLLLLLLMLLQLLLLMLLLCCMEAERGSRTNLRGSLADIFFDQIFRPISAAAVAVVGQNFLGAEPLQDFSQTSFVKIAAINILIKTILV